LETKINTIQEENRLLKMKLLATKSTETSCNSSSTSNTQLCANACGHSANNNMAMITALLSPLMNSISMLTQQISTLVNPDNYRRITVNSILGKVLEKNMLTTTKAKLNP
jgi:hypothetical protein